MSMWFILVNLFIGFVTKEVLGIEAEDNHFKEELVVRPLPSGHVYSHFEFTTIWTNPTIANAIENYKDYEFVHYDLFPRSFGEIIERYHVRELHLSLTQGLWRHHKWGYPFLEAPPGAQLWVWFNPTAENDLDQTWKDLVNALSGLFCASLNFIDSTNTVSPELSFRPMGVAEEWYSRNSSYMRYAALPRENVCTENLTPWKKLLPCDTKSGLSTLLYPTPLYSAHYHSLSLHLRPSCSDDCKSPHLELVQSLSLVQRSLQDMEGRQDWSLRKLFSAPLLSVCPLAMVSNIYVDITGNEKFESFSFSHDPSSVEEYGEGSAKKRYAVFNVAEMVQDSPFNLRANYYSKHIFGYIPSPPLQVSRFITGHGQEGGSITVKLTNNGNTPLSVIYLEVLPWYLRLFFHSSHTGYLKNTIHVSKLVTAQDRERGWLYEAVVEVPPKSSTELQLQFTRALLKWLEYPPDANHGFYLPSAIFSTVLPTATNVSNNRIEASSLREKLSVREGQSFVRIASEALLVSLPTPDFSMPYNVICLACTVVALAFGPIHNITTKRLVLKKQEPRPFFLTKVLQTIKEKLGLKPKNKELKKEGDQPTTKDPNPPPDEALVEENPLYEDISELEDILEEDLRDEEEDLEEKQEEVKKHKVKQMQNAKS